MKKSSRLPPPDLTDSSQARKKWLTLGITFAIFCCLGLAYLVYWFMWARFEEYTDDAYVNGNMVMLTPQVQGIVTAILADNAQLVEEGQPILQLDEHDYRLALEKAQADLAETVREVVKLFTHVEELLALCEMRKADLLRASLDYEHRKHLVDTGGVSKEDFEHSETTFLSAFASLVEAKKQLLAAIAQVENTTISTHPRVETAKTVVRETYLALRRCTICAPTRGIVTQRQAQVGEWVSPRDPLLAIVPLEQIWIDANFREVQLANLRIGQEVKITSDMYGSGVIYQGSVLGLNPGTGSVFSVLPPQNATGNWIKIVQRVPVRIALKREEIEKHPLLLGLSLYITVDTHNTYGSRLPQAPISSQKAIYATDVFERQLEGVEALIEAIIEENAPHEG